MSPTTSHFRIIEVLGAGGFGKVYRAESGGPGVLPRQVALKVLHNGLPRADDMASRFRDEARILARLSHRAVVKVDTLIRLQGQWCVVMEYLEGVDLKAVVQGVGALPASAALEVVAEVAGALHAAYTTEVDGRPLRLVHRDIKPPNIVITAAGEPKLLDFGVARAEFEDREAQTRSVSYGTIDYMAPESMLVEANPKGDVYGLGAILAELVLGRSIGRASPSERRHQARVDGVAREVEGVTHSPELAALVGRLLAYEPDDRPDARETQRRCLQILRTLPGEPLREWAEREVPRLREGRGTQTDELCGDLAEEVGRDPDGVAIYATPAGATQVSASPTDGASGAQAPRVSDEETAPAAASAHDRDPFATAPQRRGLGIWVVAAAGSALALFLVLGGGALAAWRIWGAEATNAPAEDIVPPEPALPEQASNEDPAPPEPARPAPKPAPLSTPAGKSDVSATKPTTPAEPATTTAASDGELAVEGDREATVLRRGGAVVHPGRVAPGQYTAAVRSSGGVESLPVTITVVAGQTSVVRCSQQLGTCRQRR